MDHFERRTGPSTSPISQIKRPHKGAFLFGRLKARKIKAAFELAGDLF
jgi:hypothetical protein